MSESNLKCQTQICRLCLALTNTSFSLIATNEASGMLEALTSLRILPSDEISTVMCLKCSLNLKLAFKIQQNMLKAEQRFHQQIPLVAKKEYDFIENTKSEILEQTPQELIKSDHTCDICGKENPSSLMLNKHKYNVHQTVECPKCLKKITRPSFKRHILRHNDADLLQIPKRVFAKVDYVPPQPKEELQEYVCDVCGKSKPTSATLKKHKRNAHVFKECPICKKKVTQTGFKRHLEAHEKRVVRAAQKAEQELAKKQEYTCDICGKKVFSKDGYRRHKYNVHLTGECPICKKKISKINLKRHIERHNDPLIVCELCGLSFKQHDLRIHHYNVHQNRSYKCEFCDKVFKTRMSKSDHENRHHLGEANFVCDTCGKKFYKSDNLRKHIKSTHLKMRPHICEFCKVGFSSKFALKTHRRQHTNEKPFKCEFCAEGFRQNVSLKSHLKSQHDVEEELICECKECGKKFASNAALISHGRIHR